MRTAKLFDLLQGISKHEFTEFGDFLACGYFNKKKLFNDFYFFLLENFEEARDKGISKQEICRTLFSGKNEHESRYWKLMSGFTSLLDDFLIQQEFKGESNYKKNLLLEAYRKRNIKSQFRISARAFSEELEKELNKGINYFQNQTHLHFQKLSFSPQADFGEVKHIASGLFENLKMNFITTNIASIAILINVDEDFFKKYKSRIWLIKEALHYIKANKAAIKKRYLTVYIFYLVLMLRIEKSKAIYNELKMLVLKNKKALSGNILRHILLNMLTFTIEKPHKGEEQYLKETVFINKLFDELELTLNGEFISHNYYYSVIDNAALCGEAAWAAKFAEKYSVYLEPDVKESAESLASARLSFQAGDLNKSMQSLLKVKNINAYFYLSHKVLLLQNYYERNEIKAIPPLISSFRKYLKRKKALPGVSLEEYGKFISYYSEMLSSVKSPGVKVRLLNTLAGEPFFINKKWLINKIGMQA